MKSASPNDVDGTVEDYADSPTRCISDDRRTNDVIAGLGQAKQEGSPSFPLGFGLCYKPQAVKGPVDMDTATAFSSLDQHLNKFCNRHQTHTINCDDENILIEASEAFRIKAPSRKVISNPKKTCTKTFKQRGSKSKSGKGKAGHSVIET